MISRRKLSKLIKEIEGYARGYGLDFFPVNFEMLDFNQMNEIASYGGFPVRTPHWRFGMQYQHLKKSYKYGLHKIYEMIINNNPCYAYLLKSNNLVDQKIVIAHVFAHCDFFKNNAYFKDTNRKMVDEMANHGQRVRKYSSKYGFEEVEEFLDICFSLENLMDPYASIIESFPKDTDDELISSEEAASIPKIKSKSYMDSYINPQPYLDGMRQAKAESLKEKKKFPESPEKDVLLFLIKYAPLENWKRDILSMIREESYYFAPQAQTKIMNEGWATYWHAKIMTTKCLEDSEVIDYADHHSGTLGVQPGSINPYKLGYELFKDIELRWNTGRFGKEYEECEDLLKKTSWDKNMGQGMQKIFQTRSIYNDMNFIDDFLTESFCRKHKLFSYKLNSKTGYYEIEDRSALRIKEKLLFSLTNLGHPHITVVDGNYGNKGELYMKHRFDGVEIRLDHAKATLEKLFTLWTRPVHLQTILGEARILLTFSGSGYSEQAISGQSAA